MSISTSHIESIAPRSRVGGKHLCFSTQGNEKFRLRIELSDGYAVSPQHADMLLPQFFESVGIQLFYPRYIVRVFGQHLESLYSDIERHILTRIWAVDDEVSSESNEPIITHIDIVYDKEYDIEERTVEFTQLKGQRN